MVAGGCPSLEGGNTGYCAVGHTSAWTGGVLRYLEFMSGFMFVFIFSVTGLHDIDEYIQAQLLLAVSIIYQYEFIKVIDLIRE